MSNSDEEDLMARIDAAADRGMEAIDHGRYIVLDSPEARKEFINRISVRVGRRARWRAFKRKVVDMIRSVLMRFR
jgi:hypothetical protein